MMTLSINNSISSQNACTFFDFRFEETYWVCHLLHPTYSEMAIEPNQSGVSLQLSGIKLETVCNLFVISENCKYVLSESDCSDWRPIASHYSTCGQPVVANSAQLVNLESVAESEKNLCDLRITINFSKSHGGCHPIFLSSVSWL